MQVHRPTVYAFIIAAGALALFHSFFLQFYLYWTYLWLDIFMHLLGGIVVALGLLACARSVASAPYWQSLRTTLGIVFVVGVGWELFELLIGATFLESMPVVDTVSDLVFDIAGGVIGHTFARMIRSV